MSAGQASRPEQESRRWAGWQSGRSRIRASTIRGAVAGTAKQEKAPKKQEKRGVCRLSRVCAFAPVFAARFSFRPLKEASYGEHT